MAGAGELRKLEPALNGRLHQGEDHFDAGEIDAVHGGELADQPDPLDTPPRVAPPLRRRPLGRDQVFTLVHEEGARLDVEHVGDFAGLMWHCHLLPSRTRDCTPLYPPYQDL